MGFALSREGYNGECAYEHIAPQRQLYDCGEWEEFERMIEGDDTFAEWQQYAVEKILKEHLMSRKK